MVGCRLTMILGSLGSLTVVILLAACTKLHLIFERSVSHKERHRDAADRTVKDIRRKTRKKYSSEDKIRIVLADLRGEDTIAELCRKEGFGRANTTVVKGVHGSWPQAFG
jgi:transposase